MIPIDPDSRSQKYTPNMLTKHYVIGALSHSRFVTYQLRWSHIVGQFGSEVKVYSVS